MPRMRSTVILSLLAFGCGPGGLNGAPVSVSDLLQQAEAAQCWALVRCGVIGASEVQACATTFFAQFSASGYSPIEAETAGRVGVDASSASACLAALSAQSCHGGNHGAVNAACKHSIVPKVAIGAACKDTAECVGGYCDNRGIAGCAGICKALVAAGGACTIDTQCGDGFECVGSPGKCSAQGGAGAACDSPGAAGCQDGLLCSSQAGMPGTCAPPPGAGQPCQLGGCAAGLYCAASPMGNPTCMAIPTSGAACTSACADDLICVGTPGQATCKAQLDAGSPCDPTLPQSSTGCPADMLCDPTAKTCQPPPPVTVGSDCSKNGECGSPLLVSFAQPLYCDGATKKCQNKVALGEACTPPMGGANPCLAGQCDPMTKTCTLACK